MTRQVSGPSPKTDPAAEFGSDLRAAFRWRGDRTDDGYFADPTGWWADPSILSRLGPALAGLFAGERPSVILGPQSRGALIASHLGVGLIELRKDPSPAADSDRWITTRTPPDYRDRNLRLGLRRELIEGHRVLLVDDWIATGGQAIGARTLVEQAGAAWCGTAVIVDGLHSSQLRRDLAVRSLLHLREL